MSKLRVNCFSISLDGFGAGLNQDLNNPLGSGGMAVAGWLVGTKTFKAMFGQEGGETGTDDDFAAAGTRNLGAWILGRNMFSTSRGSWPDDDWKGWWGDTPPYHTPVYILTHHPRPSITMKGGTVFHFVTDGIESALSQAKTAAKGQDVRLGGGVATIREYLQAKLIDSLHLAISPVLLGAGEHLLQGLDLPKLGYSCTQHAASARATHVVITR
jgi:dihydrofolate reductase